jgi:hypothetical protein
VQPGPAEYQVYARQVSCASQNSSPLSPYLPEVYAALEIVPGEHYQYMLEDLAPLYEKNSRPEWVLRASAALPALHEAMAQWQAQENEGGRRYAGGAQVVGAASILYDASFTAGLAAYAGHILPSYCAQVPSPVASTFLSHWPVIHALLTAPHPPRSLAELHGETSPGGPSPAALSPVHGDFNITNLLFHKQDPSRIKIIDWEWSGLGSPYIDLACLLHPG